MKLPMDLKNSKVVFTNGCFDLFHIGHLYSLQFASQQGKYLIVGLNSDISFEKIKNKKPIFNEVERYNIIQAIKFVDFVFIFHELTPYKLIEFLKPNVLIKGPDYIGKEKEIVGYDIVKSYGGDVIAHDYFYDRSTSDIIKQIKSM